MAAARADYGVRDHPRTVFAHQSRRAIVEAVVLRADRRLGRRDVHHAAVGSGALQHRSIGFEARQVGDNIKGDGMKTQSEDMHTERGNSATNSEATDLSIEQALDHEAVALLA